MSILGEPERRAFLASHPGWELDGEIMHRTFEFRDFSEAIGFVARVALVAERRFHHPDIDIRWNKVKVAATAHDQGGLTERDTALAVDIDGLVD